MPIFAASFSGRESRRTTWGGGGGSAWQRGWCGRRGSHSGLCSGDRHSDSWLCGLRKVRCTYEPRVSWVDWGVPEGLSKRAGGAGTACSSRSLCWQPVPAVAPRRKSGFRGRLCVQVTVWICACVWPQLFMQVANVELGWRAQSHPHALVLQGNWKPMSIALQPAGKPAHRLHGKDGTMHLNLKWIWDEYFKCCRLRMDD